MSREFLQELNIPMVDFFWGGGGAGGNAGRGKQEIQSETVALNWVNPKYL